MVQAHLSMLEFILISFRPQKLLSLKVGKWAPLSEDATLNACSSMSFDPFSDLKRVPGPPVRGQSFIP